MSISIESNVPIPANATCRQRTHYPWAKMKVGDSFQFPITKRHSVSSSASYFASKNPGFHWRIAAGEEYGRVWRVSADY